MYEGHNLVVKRCKDRQRKAALCLLGNKCQRCGITDIRVLQIDHIKGRGNQERKSTVDGRGNGIIRKILKMEHPETEYQILCANCNLIKKHENNEVDHGLGWSQ